MMYKRCLNLSQYRLGASIVVVSIASLSESYSNLLYNPLCVVRSENSTDRPQDWQNVQNNIITLITINISSKTTRMGNTIKPPFKTTCIQKPHLYL